VACGRRKLAEQQLKLRIGEELKSQIERAAAARGVSINAEVMLRLSESFENERSMSGLFDDPRVFALAELIAIAMNRTGLHAVVGSTVFFDHWTDNPFAWQQAERAAHIVLEELRPPGEIPPGAGVAFKGIDLPKRITDMLVVEMEERVGAFPEAQPLKARLSHFAARIKNWFSKVEFLL
jgi:hypothetical protein